MPLEVRSGDGVRAGGCGIPRILRRIQLRVQVTNFLRPGGWKQRWSDLGDPTSAQGAEDSPSASAFAFALVFSALL